MIYWLFSDGRDMLNTLLVPLACCTPILLLVTAAALGASIRRTSDEGANAASLTQRVMLTMTYAVGLLTVATAYLRLLGDQAVKRGRSNANDVIALLVGAPPGIHTMRLFLFGMFLAFVLMITAIGLHSLLRNGGWLREKMDQQRAFIRWTQGIVHA